MTILHETLPRILRLLRALLLASARWRQVCLRQPLLVSVLALTMVATLGFTAVIVALLSPHLG